LSEFIILTPPCAYPFQVLPSRLVDALFLDGVKRQYRFPFLEDEHSELRKSRGMPALYRVRLNRQEEQTAIYFNPNEKDPPPVIFGPFKDKEYVVTPAYWGSHWPLARGKTTGNAIDDRIYVSPAHNSMMTWARSRPVPVRTETFDTLDSLGRSRRMMTQEWVWLIGMSEATDEELLEWARSFSTPAALEIQGAKLDLDSYSPERRAYRLRVEESVVKINIKPKPKVVCRNPVFELVGAPGMLAKVSLGEQVLKAGDYAWDGGTLWVNADIAKASLLQLAFSKNSP